MAQPSQYPPFLHLSRSVAAAAVLLLAGGPGAVGEPVAGDSAPNVLLITVDTLRADHVGAYGYERPTTPNIDRLIRAGVRFAEARTVEPLTSPSLSSMLTSTHPHVHGSSRNGLRVRSGMESLPRTLEGQGYRTAAFVGNWTLRDKLSGLGEHFEQYEEVLTRKRWFGVMRREATAEDLTQQALEWLEAHRHQPSLLWVHYVEPHAPYRLHEELVESLGLDRRKGFDDKDRYDTEIAYVDRSIGELVAGVERLGLGDHTLFVFASDHGESLGEHGYWGHGRHLYEPTLRIPLALVWPERLAPATIDAPALLLDVGPTVLGLLGTAVPPAFDGYDWSGVIAGKAEPPRDRVTHYQAHRGAVLTGHDSDTRRLAGLLEVAELAEGRKEIYALRGRRRLVFDLGADAGEVHSLVAGRAATTEGLADWLAQVRAGLENAELAPPEPLDPESIEQLRSLGYVE